MVDIKALKDDILEVLKLAGVSLFEEQLRIEDLGVPHKPKSLPGGSMGVYMFMNEDQTSFMKIGKAGITSNPRFLSQHYNPESSMSNLAKSILKDPEMKVYGLDRDSVGNWMKSNLRRIDILIDGALGVHVLSFIEAFLHLKFHPKYEG